MKGSRVSSPDSAALSIEARRAAWDALWRRLLADPPSGQEPTQEVGDNPEVEAAPDSEAA
jgi:hypothetical protein